MGLIAEDLSDNDDDSVIFESHEESRLTATEELEFYPENIGIKDEVQVKDSGVIHAREYQLEMFEESLKRNIIVAMDTGTGKTQVYVLAWPEVYSRLTSFGIRAYNTLGPSLEFKQNWKSLILVKPIVWFLTPTVALCEQQARVLRSQIPAVQIKTLVGADGVETWSNVRIWDDYLKNVRIVVSTYQVLLDAVNHAFVRMDRLSLIVFDEAHNCRGKHSGAKIMDRYRVSKNAGLPIPSILGLTASPIVSSKLDTLDKIEQTLDAVCKSPSIHRDELLSVVKRPTMTHAFYTRPDEDDDYPLTKTMKSLANVYYNLDINKDPYIVRLRRDERERSQVALDRALKNQDTYVFNQVQSFWRKSVTIHRELGTWAVDYFISTSVAQFLKSIRENDSWFQGWDTQEKQYLANALQGVKISTSYPLEYGMTDSGISSKVAALIRELSHSVDGTIGIVFVREIATVAILSHILSIHPAIKDRYRVGTMIGTSNHISQKRDLGAPNKTEYAQNLKDFQDGKLNLLIATSVLEEGIDVPACNMVVCFDPPANLKTFIQRRGRARMKESKLILLMSEVTTQVEQWMELEEEMKRRYEEDRRRVQLEEMEQPEVEPFYIPETGAHLDFDQAKSHLEHFCRKLSNHQYADTRPYYIFKRTPHPLGEVPQVSATVVLPMSLPVELRRVESTGLWFTEKSASKDAAFLAYTAIYKAGFLNDNLMPLQTEITNDVESRASEIEVNEQRSPWTRIARAWGDQKELYQRRLRLVDHHGDVLCEFDATLPVPFPALPYINIIWDRYNHWKIELGQTKVISTEDLQADQSLALLDLAFRHRGWEARDTARSILHIRSPTQDIPFGELVGQKSVEEACLDGTTLIRFNKAPYLFKEWLPSLDAEFPVPESLKGEPVDIPWLLLEMWIKRKDFLHHFTQPSTSDSIKPNYIVRPARLCRVDGIHVSNVHFGMLIPSIMHMIEIHLVATELCNTILKDVGFKDISLVITAISAPSAREETNYERFEFLGDSTLKLLATATITANNPIFTEGYLDAFKTSTVSNARLCRAAVETGLDRFILKKPFTGAKWKPIYVEDVLDLNDNADDKRVMSTKTLADVVEALVGAAYEDGGIDGTDGIDKALTCLRIFIPDVQPDKQWHSLDSACKEIFNQTTMSTYLPPPLAPLEELIGYSFRNKNLLVEAATHSSFGFVDSTGNCMERLEFLGDAILDSVVVSALWKFPRNMSQGEMHLLRTACVNGDLLGFFGMEWSIEQEATQISEDKTTIETSTTLPFWKFMRHTSQDMGIAQHVAEERHAQEREAILEAIKHGSEYPWAQLFHLHIPKFFSDFFESVLGAVWVDSQSLDVCASVVEKVGILPYLRRMLAGGVDVLHPKNHLGHEAGRIAKPVEYQTEVRDAQGRDRELICRVLVGDEMIAEVGGGVSPEEVQTRAAYAAYKILVKRREEGGGVGK
ncbi:Dicer-like protein 2 [Daldinia childiae]|uniref:Dicer-like protein 2 n=1 Tax=Daldinia childiae TaxID=326645 RepID=UPI001444C705|nr:Dicer-like protein 2 [Daldinia childiae]KAF3071126.1 Dicer-like protein 2 [Daldinia childiae]